MGSLVSGRQGERMNQTISVILLAKKWIKKGGKAAKVIEEHRVGKELLRRKEGSQKGKLSKSVSYSLGEKSEPVDIRPHGDVEIKIRGDTNEVSHRKHSKKDKAYDKKSGRKFSLKARKLQLLKSDSLSNSCPDLSVPQASIRNRISRHKNEENLKPTQCTCCLSALHVIDRNTVDMFSDNSPPKDINLIDIYFD